MNGTETRSNPISYGEAKHLAHAPPLYLESNQATPGAFRLGGPENDDSSTITYGEEIRRQASTQTYQVNARLVEENKDPRCEPIR
jgi:hypothetical protein